MKIKVEIDCTPKEAREFLGLPDFQPVQKAAMETLQARIQGNIEQLSLDKLMQSWFDPKMATRLQNVFSDLTGFASERAAKDKT
jgi:hypothetical protein